MTTCTSVGQILKQTWGYDALRPLQQEVVDAALAGKDALVVMPTGSGKSLCFQIPPLVDGSLTVVISPLISLMADQVHSLHVVGVPAAALNSSLDAASAREVESRIESGQIRILYVSPEKMATDSLRTLLKRANQGRGVGRFAIDEAHCISEWGHDFRPEYRILNTIRRDFPDAPIHALTATATVKVREDILRQLKLRDPEVFVGSFDRPNLTFRVVPRSNSAAQVSEIIKRYPNDACIVYCLSRKDTETLAAALNHLGIPSRAYHAGLDNAVRAQISHEFATEKVNVVVATVAFGMGIDRSNVRAVIHTCLPKSIESYQQETGRAGRDGLESECVLLYTGGDVVRIERFFEGGDPAHVAIQRQNLHEVRGFATAIACRHRLLVEYFGQKYEGPEPCGACDVCLEGTSVVPDSTKIAHRILVTVRDLSEGKADFGFGANHIAAVLCGADTKTVRGFGHASLRGYGSMKSYARERVVAWIHQLVDQRLLRQTEGLRSFLMVTEAAIDTLAERSEVVLRDPRSVPMALASRDDSFEGMDNALVEGLRALRRNLAAERSLAAFLLFDDKTMRHLATMRPSTVNGLLAVPGMGEKRVADFGAALVAFIAQHCAAHRLAMDQPLASRAPAKPVRVTGSAITLKPLFDQGLSVAECAKQVGLAQSTVSGYLIEYCQQNPDRAKTWVEDATVERVRQAKAELGDSPLKVLFEKLNAEVSYDSLRIAAIRLREPKG